jgi:hypothetical protein
VGLKEGPQWMHISAYSGKSLRRMSTWWRPISRASPSAGPTRPRRSREGSFRIQARPRQVDRQGKDIGFSYERFCHASDLSVNHAAIQVDARLRERANWGDLHGQSLAEFVAMWTRYGVMAGVPGHMPDRGMKGFLAGPPSGGDFLPPALSVARRNTMASVTPVVS